MFTAPLSKLMMLVRRLLLSEIEHRLDGHPALEQATAAFLLFDLTGPQDFHRFLPCVAVRR